MATQLFTSFQNGTKIEFKSKIAGASTPESRVARSLQHLLLDALGLGEDMIRAHHSRPWSSATFAGTRFTWEVLISDLARSGAFKFCVDAAEREWPLKGAFVADFCATLGADTLIVEALTVFES